MDVKRNLAEEIMELMKKSNVPAKFDRKDAHVKLLDDLVNVNSLFTLAVFVGLSQASPGIRSLENRDECNAGPGVAKMLVLYEVVAFACFLLSSLVAKVLKLVLSLDGKRFHIIREGFDMKDGLLVLTACASVSGIILLTLSVVNVVQIRIGLYACGSAEARRAIWALCTIVSIALVIYVLSITAAVYASVTGDTEDVETASSNGVPNHSQSSDKGSTKVNTDSAQAAQVVAGLPQSQDDLV